jgi:hypothetical protein
MNKRVMTCTLVLLFAATGPVSIGRERSLSRQLHSYITEAMARERITTSVMPVFPDTLLRPGFASTVIAKIEFDGLGNLLTVKVHPDTTPLIKESLSKALPLWRFGLEARFYHSEGVTILSRLTFNFFVRDGKGTVEMYNPPPSAAVTERLDYLHSEIELNDWLTWEQIYLETKPKATGIAK